MCSRCVCVCVKVCECVCLCVCVLMRVNELISLSLLALQCGTLLSLAAQVEVALLRFLWLSKIGLTIVCVSSVRYVSGNPRTVLLCLCLRLRLCLPFSVFTFNYIRRALTRDFFHLPWNRALLLSLSLSRLASSRVVFVCVFFFWLPPRITFYLRILCLSTLLLRLPFCLLLVCKLNIILIRMVHFPSTALQTQPKIDRFSFGFSSVLGFRRNWRSIPLHF